jgi:hypothetical protein
LHKFLSEAARPTLKLLRFAAGYPTRNTRVTVVLADCLCCVPGIDRDDELTLQANVHLA